MQKNLHIWRQNKTEIVPTEPDITVICLLAPRNEQKTAPHSTKRRTEINRTALTAFYVNILLQYFRKFCYHIYRSDTLSFIYRV